MQWLSRWRMPHLVLSWIAYWAALIAVRLGPGIAAAYRASQLGDDKGDIGLSFGTAGFSATVSESGVTTWHGATTILGATLWIVGPPLALWWLWVSSRRPAVIENSQSAAALTEPAQDATKPSANIEVEREQR